MPQGSPKNPAPSFQEEGLPPNLTNNLHYIKDLSFENQNLLKAIGEDFAQPSLDVNIHVDVSLLDESVYEVTIVLNVRGLRDHILFFLIELTYGGVFHVDPLSSEDDRKKLLLIDAPYLLFPFARSIVANLTRDGGLPPLLLNSVRFEKLYEQAISKEKNKKH